MYAHHVSFFFFASDAPIIVESRVHEMIDKRMKGVPDEKRVHEMIDERMKAEKVYCYSAEEVQFLDILKSRCFCDAVA